MPHGGPTYEALDYPVPPQTNGWWPGFRAPPPLPAIGGVCDICHRWCLLTEPCKWCLKDKVERLEQRLDEELAKASGPKRKKKP